MGDRVLAVRIAAGLLGAALIFTPASRVQAQAPAQNPAQATASRDLAVTVGKSVLVDSPTDIERISLADGAIAEAVAISPREVQINGKTPGETSLIVWQMGGNRL